MVNWWFGARWFGFLIFPLWKWKGLGFLGVLDSNPKPPSYHELTKQLANLCRSKTSKKKSISKSLGIARFHDPSQGLRWYLVWHDDLAALATWWGWGVCVFLGYSFLPSFLVQHTPSSFCCPETHFPKKIGTELGNRIVFSSFFVWYLSNQINFNPVSPNPEKPGTNGKDWNFSSEQNSPRNHSLWFGISGSAKRGRVFSRVGLMLQNSWQLQLIWKLMILICFHRALFFTSEVCRFCWVPDVYFTSSRYLNTLLPPISILSNLITDASQEACWIKGILVTYFQNGRNVKEWSANPEFEPGGICMWFYRISTKMNHQQAIPRQKLTRVCI